MAGIPDPSDIDGISLVPVIQGEKDGVRDALYTSYKHTVRAVRNKKYKLIRYPERDYTQLFDLENDPLEINNLAEKSEYQSRKSEMMELMEKWQHNFQDTLKLTADKIKPMKYDPDTLVRKPDQWQPEYTLKRYFEVDKK